MCLNSYKHNEHNLLLRYVKAPAKEYFLKSLANPAQFLYLWACLPFGIIFIF